MASVAAKGALAAPQAVYDLPRHIHNGHGHDQQSSGDFGRGNNGQSGQRIPQKIGASRTEENAGGPKVKGQEAHQGPRQGQGDEGDAGLAEVVAVPCKNEGGNRPHACRQPI